MEIVKEAERLENGMVTAEELRAVNALARRELKAEEVYIFTVKLCDNEVDRDGERFTTQTLAELSELFVGKTGIFDHQWSTQGQTARIYRTRLCTERRKTAAGDDYCYLKAWAYLLRTEKNADLIAEIEGGIKKEVSVGVSVGRSVCSVCGQDIASCGHERGRVYDGTLCFAELQDAQDAYEWSFVAVPAQREAGVMKGMGMPSLRACVKRHGTPALSRELETLEREAAVGRAHMEALRGEVRRLMLTADETLSGAAVETMVRRLDEPELRELERVFAARTAKKLGLAPQLSGAAELLRREEDGAFRV